MGPMHSSHKVSVVVDGIAFENPYQRGVWRVFYEVMRRTSKQIDYNLLLRRPAVQPIPHGVRTIEGPPRSRGRFQFISRSRQLRWEARFDEQYHDAIWHSSFYTADPRPNGVSVVLVHDLIAEKMFWMHPALRDQIATRQQCLHRASHVIAISASTAHDLRQQSANDLNVTIAPLGPEHLPVPTDTGDVARHRDVLYVGARGEYKNFGCVVAALSLPTWPRDCRLQVVGAKPTTPELDQLRRLGVDDRVEFLGPVDDRGLATSYRDSLAFVFPSLWEGFGLPTLEAQRCGTPVILSDIPVFREVAGQTGIYFDPRDPESLADAVELVSKDRERWIEPGRSNAARYSWDQTAEAWLSAYREVWEGLHGRD